MTTNTPSRTTANWRSSKALTVVAAFLALFALVGFALYGLPFFYDFMVREYGWSRAIVTSGNALGKLLVGPLFGFIAGWMVDRFGPQRMMAAGALMGGLALAGLSRADTLPLFYLFYILNALAYVCGGPLPCQVLIARRFDKNRGKAMGIAYLGIGAGGALVPLLAARLQDVMGWHHALLALGGLIVLLALPLPLILKSPGAASQPTTAAPQPAAPKGEIGAILRSPAFYLLAFGSMCSIGAVGGVMQHLKLYLRDQAFTQEGAARILSLVLLSSLVGRVLMGWLADRFSRKRVMILIYMLVACTIPLLLMPAFPGRIYLFALIFGIGLGGDYMIIPLMAGDLFGVRALGRVMGIILVADGVAESAFPMLVGVLYNEATKSYALGFSVLIALALTGAILIALLPKQSLVLGSDQTR